MATTRKKITLSPSRDIPFNQLILSQSNVRHVKAGVSIEELAEDIARCGLLQGLSVHPVTDERASETGMFEIPAGGRRYRALELLVSQKRLAKTALVPCVVRGEGIAAEDSLAENIQHAPLDQFRAFLTLREKGQSEEEIAATFFVSVNVVKQRLKLAAVSPKLLEVYAEDGMTLDQLMAFTVSADPKRQEQVFDQLQHSYDKPPYVIRRMLTEGAVRACDKRARFIGIDAYVAVGGDVLRDLFQADDGGWLQDVALVDQMVSDKLAKAAAEVSAEGWKWVNVATDFAYGHEFGLPRLRGETAPLTVEEEAAFAALQEEYDRLDAENISTDDIPDDVDERMAELETMPAAFDDRPLSFDPEEVSRAGAFVSVAHDGNLRIERGYVRPEDELPLEMEIDQVGAGDSIDTTTASYDDGDNVVAGVPDQDADDGPSLISDRLMMELTVHRTVGLRQALGERPDVAFLAALHTLTLKVFYQYTSDSCLELDLRSSNFSAQVPGLNESTAADAVRIRHAQWENLHPRTATELWEALESWDAESRLALFAHVVSLSVNAVHESWNRRPRALAHADRLARAVNLDMAAAGWRATTDTFLGRVTKALILKAVSEAKGQAVADRIAHMKKDDMAAQAETLLADTTWLPEPLRTPNDGGIAPETAAGDEVRDAVEASAVNDDEAAIVEDGAMVENELAEDATQGLAAE